MISVFNIDQLSQLLHSYHVVSNMRVTIFDTSFHEVVAYPEHIPDFCALLRQNPNALRQCNICDQNHCMKVQNSQKPLIYQCHSGLTEAIAPLRMNGSVIGYIIFGHIAPSSDKNKGWEIVKEKCSDYDVDNTLLKNYFKHLHYFSTEYINAASKLLEAVASYACTERLSMIKYDTFSTSIDHYIMDHFTENITSEDICEHFQISKSKLYQISEDLYHCGIATYIRKLRIDLAKKLLEQSNSYVQEIAYTCGYDDYNYFTKIFKRETGLTPREYRKVFESL